MSKYSTKLQEEELKLHIADDWFAAYDCKRRIGKIDFCVDIPATELGLFEATSALWAEAKAGTSKDIHESFVQLILTIGRAKVNQRERPPFFLGAFDAKKIAFLPYESVMEVFTQNDFNWNVTPSDHTTKEFKQLYDLVRSTIEEKSLLYDYETDADDLKNFIKENFKTGQRDVSKIQITRNNFTHIYQKWRLAVLPTLDVPTWDTLRKDNIIDADFFLADILSDKDNRTIRKKLYVLLQSDIYEVKYGVSAGGLPLTTRIGFNDGQRAHKQFWNKYSRPPRRDYWDFIVSRRDLLVDQDIRERKGAFFTPQKWVALSQEYLAKALGDNWQDEYVILDCCAGTGNLEAGLTNKYNIWVCTLDKADVDVIHTRIKMMEEQRAGSSNLLDSHVFQFDFLNDSFDKFPKGLRDIVNDPEKRKKLVVYINPPYAEASTASNRFENCSKTSVAKETAAYAKWQGEIGTAARELFALFLIRISKEMKGAKIGQFSSLKIFQSGFFEKFRNSFASKIVNAFVVPADTFDNVDGKFPIGFFVWDTDSSPAYDVSSDIYTHDAEYAGKKELIAVTKGTLVIDWLKKFHDKVSPRIGFLRMAGTDMQHNMDVFITNHLSPNDIKYKLFSNITANNILQSSVYAVIRSIVSTTWLNNRDQFRNPDDGVLRDFEFLNNCLCYAIFENNIKVDKGENHWIPYTESEVGAQDKFASHFMSDFIAGRIESRPSVSQDELGIGDSGASRADSKPYAHLGPIQFSPAARAVLDAGRELWRYYHQQPNANPNASYYDIRRNFQGVKVDAKGKDKMNSTSENERYNELNDALKAAMKTLAREIEPKIYEYGFLKR